MGQRISGGERAICSRRSLNRRQWGCRDGEVDDKINSPAMATLAVADATARVKTRAGNDSHLSLIVSCFRASETREQKERPSPVNYRISSNEPHLMVLHCFFSHHFWSVRDGDGAGWSVLFNPVIGSRRLIHFLCWTAWNWRGGQPSGSGRFQPSDKCVMDRQ